MRWLLLVLCFCRLAGPACGAAFPSPDDWRDENIYFIFTDRFNDGDPSNNSLTPGAAYAPTNSRGIHGGDFKGIEQKADYIRGLGATAIWITPIPLNDAGSAYHGYGARDFYQLAPHLGTLTDLSNMVAACHARGIKVILDVVVNHSGNLVDSGDAGYPNYNATGYTLRYRNNAIQHAPPFNVTNVTPATLTSLFHNHGVIQDFNNPDQVEKGELSNLDDFNTQLPYVRTNMAAIWKYWIQVADVDGFRVDTVKHVEHGNGGFWNYWCPEIRNFATSLGKSNFFLFGEVYDGSDQKCGAYTGTKLSSNFAFDSVLDYPLYYLIGNVFAAATGNTKQLEDRYNNIAANYDPAAHYRLVTFLDNHDQRRFLNINSATNRLGVALAFLYTARGIPCLYYGTEQAFNGGTDPNNREDMFDGQFETGPSLGDNFNMAHPLYRHVAFLNNLRRVYPALRRGDHANRWNNPSGPGLFAYARRFETQEVFVAFNTGASSATMSARPTIYPAGTVLVNLFNTNETLTVTTTPEIPAITVPSRQTKIFVARNQFQPLNPVVVSVSPAHAAVNVATNTPVVLRFSKPMNTNSVHAAFSLGPGTFAWSGLTQLTFTATGGLPTGTTNVVRIATNAVDNVDGQPFFAPFESYFVTTGSPGADTTPPLVNITAPAANAQLTGVAMLTGTASDVGTGVNRVEVRVNGGAWTPATGTTAWSYALDTTKFLNGTNIIINARATDNATNVSAIASVTVKFFNIPGDFLARLSAGNPNNVTNCDEVVWFKDQAYAVGSFGYVGGVTGHVASAVISNVCPAAQPLYRWERYSDPANSFRYLFDCPEGIYETTLLEAETYFSNVNQRVFNVLIESQQVLTNFDILAVAGGANVPLALVFTNAVADSQLEVQFFPQIDNARVSGIQVRKIADLDTDADGIPDWWMLAYFDHPTGQEGDGSLAGDDPDGDGATNLDEFLSGTNPLVSDLPAFPAAPSELTATAIFEGQVALTWRDNSTNEIGFALERAPSGAGPWTLAVSVPAGRTNALDCAVGDGLVAYRVTATNTIGGSVPSNLATVIMPGTNLFLAFDRASHAPYGTAWPDGSNGGYGFGPWRLVRSSTGANTNGFYSGSSTNNGSGGGVGIDSCGEAFGLYANSGASAVAYRPLRTPLAIGQRFRWRMDNGWVTTGNTIGLVLRTGNTTNTTANYNTGARFEWLFQGGSNTYHIVDNAGRRDTGVAYSTRALELEFLLTGTNTYALRVGRLENGFVTNLTGTLAGASGATIDSFAAYNRNAGAGAAYDVFFNYFIRITATNGPTDTVGDGIPDAWRVRYFGGTGTTTNALSCAACDPDGDGQQNRSECLAGTDPLNAADWLRITAVSPGRLAFPTVAGVRYAVETNRDLLHGQWAPLTNGVLGTGNLIEIGDPSAVGLDRQFYRVRVIP